MTTYPKRWPRAMAVLLAFVFSLAIAGRADAAGRLAALRAARTAPLDAAAAPVAPQLVSKASLSDPNAGVLEAAPCCPQRCIVYRHHGPKLCCGCEPPTPTTLRVEDPCTCCPVDISVCLPACCTGAPSICCHKGILGRTVVTYDWCCGFRVTVRFLANGDIVVATRGV